MVIASFEHEGNLGSLKVVTHFDTTHVISCTKHDGESFRLGGTAVNEVMVYEGVILNLPLSAFRAFVTNERVIEDKGILSPENWSDSDLHCYVHEHYPLDMEGKTPGWFIASHPLQNAHHIFVNLDVLDGGGNVIKRYRVSPFTGEHVVLEYVHG
jgi:hypothetical protein